MVAPVPFGRNRTWENGGWKCTTHTRTHTQKSKERKDKTGMYQGRVGLLALVRVNSAGWGEIRFMAVPLRVRRTDRQALDFADGGVDLVQPFLFHFGCHHERSQEEPSRQTRQ